ncbi:MAG: hypothetical protein IT290_04630 [Deltaproteobacteria bacterium]|nr:hypothetical protein [Deltaproteobacteria bacterium]
MSKPPVRQPTLPERPAVVPDIAIDVNSRVNAQEIPAIRNLVNEVMLVVDLDPAIRAVTRDPRMKLEVAIVPKSVLDKIITQRDPGVSQESLKSVDGYTTSEQPSGPGFYRMYVDENVLSSAPRTIVTLHNQLHHVVRGVKGPRTASLAATDQEVQGSALEGLRRIETSLRSSPRVAYQNLGEEMRPLIEAEARRLK